MKDITLGDRVNTASPLESLSKEVVLPHLADSPCRILISETTLHYLGDQLRTERVCKLALKGKEQKVTIYCMFGRISETRAAAIGLTSSHGQDPKER